MSRSVRDRLLASVALACACAAGGRPVEAADETGALLQRARTQVTPTVDDQRVARELLEDWVDTHPDDVYLRAALRKIAQGMPPGGEELPAIQRLHDRYTVARAKAEARARGESVDHDRVHPSPGRTSSAPSRLPLRELAVVGGITLAVLGVGVVFVFRARGGGR